MESSFIVLKVMSCRDLRAFNFFQKLSVYAQVSIESEDPAKKVEKTQKQRTPTDLEGDGNPEWNHEMKFDLDEVLLRDYDDLHLLFELQAEGLVFGAKNIGEVHVPFKDLIGEFNDVVKFVSYEIRGGDGKPNGVLNFSYKVNRERKGDGIDGGSSVITGIDGYSVVHLPPPEALYPSLEWSNFSPEIYPRPESDQYFSPQVQHISHEVNYPPPYDVYYPPPMPAPSMPPQHDMYYPPPGPPPPHLHHSHVRPLRHGPFHHQHLPPPPPPPMYPWEFTGSYH